MISRSAGKLQVKCAQAPKENQLKMAMPIKLADMIGGLIRPRCEARVEAIELAKPQSMRKKRNVVLSGAARNIAVMPSNRNSAISSRCGQIAASREPGLYGSVRNSTVFICPSWTRVKVWCSGWSGRVRRYPNTWYQGSPLTAMIISPG